MTARRYIPVITLKVNGLSAPAKRQKPAESIQKQDLYICCLHETDLPQTQGHEQTESEGTEKVVHTNGNQKKAGVAIFIADKIYFKMTIIKDKEGHYIMINGSTQEEDIRVVNIYALNIGVPQCIQQILTAIKRETDSNTMIVRNFNTPLLSMDK